MQLKKVNPHEVKIRSALLADLKERMGGWRKDHTGKQIGKLRGMSSGGAVEAPKEPTEEESDEVPANKSNDSQADEAVAYGKKIDGGASDGEDGASDRTLEDQDDSGNDPEPDAEDAGEEGEDAEKEESIEDLIRKLSRSK